MTLHLLRPQAILLTWRICRRRPDGKVAAVGECESGAVDHPRTVLRAKAFNLHFRPDGQRFFRHSSPRQRRRRVGFDRPVVDGATRLFHIDIDPSVRIRSFDFRDRAAQGDRLGRIEFRSEGMMRGQARPRAVDENGLVMRTLPSWGDCSGG